MGHGRPPRRCWYHDRCTSDSRRLAATPKLAALGHKLTDRHRTTPPSGSSAALQPMRGILHGEEKSISFACGFDRMDDIRRDIENRPGLCLDLPAIDVRCECALDNVYPLLIRMGMGLRAGAGGHAHQGYDHAVALDAGAGCGRVAWPAVDLGNFGEIETIFTRTCAFGTGSCCSRYLVRHTSRSSQFESCGFHARQGFGKSLLFPLDVRRLDDRPPLLDLGLVKRSKRFRRLLVTRWNVEPESAQATPDDALLGFAFNQAMRPFRSLAGKAFFEMINWGLLASSATGSKSFNTSCGSA